MAKKTLLDIIFRNLIIILPIFTGYAISAFLSGKIISMPSDFPYNRGTWGALGVAIILLASFIIALLFYVVACRLKNTRSRNTD